VPRPRTVDDEAVLDAAARAIGRVGPGGLTLAAMAREVGLSPATLVQRFGSKRGLLLAIAARGSGKAALSAAAVGPSPVLPALVDALVARVAAIDAPATLANHLAFLQIDLADPEFHGHAAADAARMREALQVAVEAALARGELRPVGTAALARALQVTYNGALVTWAIEREGALDDYLRRELEVTLAPYRRGPTSGSD
jgi:AcrR family transcriptional regulator